MSSLIVCATQRSGSTLLCELLKATGVAGIPNEYFQHFKDTGLVDQPRQYLAGLDDEFALSLLPELDIGRITLRTAAPVLADPYAANRATGAFILIDERTHDTVAAGMVEVARAGRGAEPEHSPDIRWHPSALARSVRWGLTQQRGATVWLTGLPASGKSTIAAAVERELVEAGRFAYLLDGDNLRHGLSGDLGFDPASRSKNIRRVAHVARLFADAGAVAIVSLVSPFREDRLAARALHEAAGLEFIEVFVDTPLEECARRDPKGLYARARAGRLTGMTGENAPYEPPEAAELVIRDEPTELSALRPVAALA